LLIKCHQGTIIRFLREPLLIVAYLYLHMIGVLYMIQQCTPSLKVYVIPPRYIYIAIWFLRCGSNCYSGAFCQRESHSNFNYTKGVSKWNNIPAANLSFRSHFNLLSYDELYLTFVCLLTRIICCFPISRNV